MLGIRLGCDLPLHENLSSSNNLHILGKTIVYGQRVLSDTVSAEREGKSLGGKWLHLIPTACLGRDGRLHSYSSDVKHLQQHLGPVKISSKSSLDPGNNKLCRTHHH